MEDRYIYGMKLRPFSIGCQPPGHIDYIDSNKKESGFYGFVVYEKELSSEMMNRFELAPVSNPELLEVKA
jgi:hypothetical protein